MIYPIVTQTGFAKLLFEKKDFTKMFNTLCCPGFATGLKQKGLAQKEKYPFSSLVIPLLTL